MAISEDLRSVRTMLATTDSAGEEFVRLLCDNLAALADQVEALEAVPLAPCFAPPCPAASSTPGILAGASLH